jgi:hypothetical protein
MTESVALQNPDLPMDLKPDAALYVGMLEGTIAALAINEVKYRALLEILTGDPWEDTRIDFKGEVLQQLATDVLVKQTGMDRVKAQVLVAKRWQARNLEPDVVVPRAVNPQDYVSGNSSPENKSMSERAKIWREKQIADSEKLDVEKNGTDVPENSSTEVPEK